MFRVWALTFVLCTWLLFLEDLVYSYVFSYYLSAEDPKYASLLSIFPQNLRFLYKNNNLDPPHVCLFLLFPIPQPVLSPPVFCNWPQMSLSIHSPKLAVLFHDRLLSLTKLQNSMEDPTVAQWARGHRFNSRSRKIPHAAEQWSNWRQILSLHAGAPRTKLPSPQAETPEPECPKSWSPRTREPVPHSKGSQDSEKSVHSNPACQG